MNIFSILILIALIEHCSADHKKVEEAEVNHSGVVTEMIPEGIMYYPTKKIEYLDIDMWSTEEMSDTLKFSCYKYSIGVTRRKMPIDEFKVTVETKLEGFQIENYVVTGCPPYEQSPLMQYTTVTRNEKGYKYVTVFKDEKENCYSRTYVTEHDHFTTKLTRYDAEPHTCTEEEVSKMGHLPKTFQGLQLESPQEPGHKGDDKNRLLIKSWSISGVFDKSISKKDVMSHEESVKSWRLLGNCQQVSLSCRKHRIFSSEEDILVVDIFTELQGTPLDRVVVTSCEERGLWSSFKCVKRSCNAEHLYDIKNCEYTMMYQIPDGTCKERSYKVALEEDDEVSKPLLRLSVNRYDTKPAKCHWDMWNQANLYIIKKGIRSTASAIGNAFVSKAANKIESKENKKLDTL